MTMNFKGYLKSESGKIEITSEKLLNQWEKEVGDISTTLIPLVKAFKKSHIGGKGIRGVLVKVGYQIAGGKNEKAILDIASAYEIFHTSILAHDDIIDRSTQRRGEPSLYEALGGKHYGISQAICLADCGFFLAVKIISESEYSPKEKNKALQFFAKTMLDTALGEMLDVEGGDVTTIMKLKTAKYTVSSPLQLGAILAQGEDKLIRVMEEFGENLGIAFQIQDDILGVFGSLEQIGKSITSDIEEGKNTWLYIEALKRASVTQKRDLEKYYGKGKINTTQLEIIKKIFQDTRALEEAQNKALGYASKAKKIIPQITTDREIAKLLQEMTEYLVERSK